MLVRCAWCKKIVGNKPPFGGKWDEEITDGICAECLKRYFGVLKNDQARASKKNSSGSSQDRPTVSDSG
jgi:hypothetical protein